MLTCVLSCRIVPPMTSHTRLRADDALWHATYVAACLRIDRPTDLVAQALSDDALSTARARFHSTGGTAERADEITEAAFRVAEALTREVTS